MGTRQLLPWEILGRMISVGKAHGKRLFQYAFRNPFTAEEDSYTFFAQKDWAVIVPVTPSGKVIVGRQYKHGVALVASLPDEERPGISEFLESREEVFYLNGGLIDELPAGTTLTGHGSSMLAVMKDRLRAETGYVADTVVPLGHPMFIATRSSPTRFHMFLGMGCRKVAPQRDDPKEVVEMRTVELAQWLQMCLDGSIVEPSAVCATMLAIPHLRKAGLLRGISIEEVCERVVPLAA